ncbi:MAG: nicotinate-nucleotide adenylyltransferase [Proteobacteria bacterium]|nr:nicotinate-nucleotide adenylyltransferase [Pseudomonadota bacterium]
MRKGRPFAAIGGNGPVRLPFHAPGMRIGLFGGSFNPPHDGHRLVAKTALSALRLDRLWWIVTPGNPLKNNTALPSQNERMALCRALMPDPRIEVTGFEASIGTRYTYDTLRYLEQRCPGVDFVWIMGADSLAGFHRWQKWRDIARMIPIAIIDRPGSTLRAAASKAAQVFGSARIDETDAALLPGLKPPAWVFLYGPRSSLSSTELRARPKVATS